jgi:hypothetical protein
MIKVEDKDINSSEESKKQFSAEELNNPKNERENLVLILNEGLDPESETQMVRSVDYLSKAMFYKDIGDVDLVKLIRPHTDGKDIETLIDGIVVMFKPRHVNKQSVQLKLNKTEIKNFVKANGEAFKEGELHPDKLYIAIYNASKNVWVNEEFSHADKPNNLTVIDRPTVTCDRDLTFIFSKYIHLGSFVAKHTHTIIEICEYEDFTCGVVKDILNKSVTVYRPNGLKPNTSYFIRIKYVGGHFTSEYSKPYQFITPDSRIESPVIKSTYKGNVLPTTNLTFTTNRIVSTNEYEMHNNTDWLLRDENDRIVWKSLSDINNLTRITISDIKLESGKTYKLDARHNSLKNSGDMGTFVFRTLPKTDKVKLTEHVVNMNEDSMRILLIANYGENAEYTITSNSKNINITRVEDKIVLRRKPSSTIPFKDIITITSVNGEREVSDVSKLCVYTLAKTTTPIVDKNLLAPKFIGEKFSIRLTNYDDSIEYVVNSPKGIGLKENAVDNNGYMDIRIINGYNKEVLNKIVITAIKMGELESEKCVIQLLPEVNIKSVTEKLESKINDSIKNVQDTMSKVNDLTKNVDTIKNEVTKVKEDIKTEAYRNTLETLTNNKEAIEKALKG